MGAFPESHTSHAHPAHGPAMTCHDYDIPGGEMEAIGRTGDFAKAGYISLRTTDPDMAGTLAATLTRRLGAPGNARGRSVSLWDVASDDAAFAERTQIAISRENGATVLRLERRRPVADPAARAAMTDAPLAGSTQKSRSISAARSRAKNRGPSPARRDLPMHDN